MNIIQDLQPFNSACEEFIAGKYLLADIKISSILTILDNNDKLKNLVNNCIQNFNFNAEYSKFLEVNNIYFLKTEAEIVAFVYSLLYQFKTAKLDFYKFLSQIYGLEDNNKTFSSFTNEIFIPFKNAINNVYSKYHIFTDTDEYQNNVYNKLMSTTKLILNNLDVYKLNMNQKEEFTMLLHSLFIASEKNDKKLVYSLMIGLDYFSKSNKKSRNAYLSLEECFEKTN